MKKLGLATALLLAMTGAQAYQFEVQGQSEYIDNTVNDKNFTGAVQGTYYFKNVDSSKGPLAEAAFLNQASNASLAYNYGDYDVKADADKNFVSHTIGAKAEAYVPTKVVPVYASVNYNHTITDGKDGQKDDDGDRYALEFGAVVAPNFLVAVGYTSVADQTSYDAFNIMNNGVAKAALESAAINQDQDAITARAKYVGAIDGTNMAVGFESGIVYGEDTAYNLKTDLYLTPALSVGASYAESSYAGSPDKAWAANVNYFITPAVAVGASYVNANYEADKTARTTVRDTQTVGLNAKFRF
ncbi:carbapenem susceptibility porin CarO [Acinetobacter chinensis]|uniref:Carbapenem susceptibility porin CarO n=2 Tax=Acinetobacter chinensis TaxID=2004650 RepID=A0A3B7M187_9GAMM|nr:MULTISPECIES: porin Omp33-36 [Acinetobacter]AXY58135.1 carbapenem susceptibility porin CarO [Acinetobacter chinensis]AXY58798.1 carbapenem susceptibility porin CarO [Acinetobacter sp. WCHAc010052]MDV2469231.1 porin Omp33-36 [Acinetobacter chinensis]WOE41432.1 porin Omp33-36 [Acinetobacter chinensis]